MLYLLQRFTPCIGLGIVLQPLLVTFQLLVWEGVSRVAEAPPSCFGGWGLAGLKPR